MSILNFTGDVSNCQPLALYKSARFNKRMDLWYNICQQLNRRQIERLFSRCIRCYDSSPDGLFTTLVQHATFDRWKWLLSNILNMNVNIADEYLEHNRETIEYIVGYLEILFKRKPEVRRLLLKFPRPLNGLRYTLLCQDERFLKIAGSYLPPSILLDESTEDVELFFQRCIEVLGYIPERFYLNYIKKKYYLDIGRHPCRYFYISSREPSKQWIDPTICIVMGYFGHVKGKEDLKLCF